MVIARLTPMIHLYRLNRPIGIWLLMLPCWWGVALCSSPFTKQFWQSLGLYLIGAVCLRSAGCIINDWADQSYDARVTRTRNRPLACQAVSKAQALGLFLVMMVGGVGVWLCLNLTAKILSILAFGLLFIYPFMKRITYWPQLILGLAFNSGVLIACANQGSLGNVQPWLLYGVGILWTLAYDTIYAFQDIDDDQLLGLKSTAILFQKWPRLLPAICYGGMFSLLYILSGARPSFFILAIMFLVVFFRLKQWKPDNSADCLAFFKEHVYLGFIILFWLLYYQF